MAYTHYLAQTLKKSSNMWHKHITWPSYTTVQLNCSPVPVHLYIDLYTFLVTPKMVAKSRVISLEEVPQNARLWDLKMLRAIADVQFVDILKKQNYLLPYFSLYCC